MKVKTGLRLGMLVALLGAAGCYSKVCVANDPACWPCDNPANQNPGCVTPWTPIPISTKNHDGGADR